MARIPKLHFPNAITLDYYRKLKAMIQATHEEVKFYIENSNIKGAN
jgi:hypothetical protein